MPASAWPATGWPARRRSRRAAAGSARRGADSTRAARRRRAAAAPAAPDPAHTATAWAAPSWHCATAVRRDGSAAHRTVGIFAGATLGVALELGDRLVDSAGVAADRAVDEGGRVVEIVGAGQQIRVLPDRVAGVDTDSLGQPLPQRRGLSQLAWPQFQAD